MFHKSQTTIKNQSKTLNYKPIALKVSTRKSRLTSKSPSNTKKRVTPRVHSSFTICDEIYSPHPRLRSTSVDRKQKTISFDYSSLRKTHNPMQAFQQFDEKVLKCINFGRQEIQKNKFSEAVGYLTQALEVDNKCLDALYNRGIALMLMGMYKEATIDFLNVLRENVMYGKDVYFKLAVCFYNMKDINTAIRYVSQGIHRYPKFGEGLVFRGQLYNEQKQFEKAISDFKKAINIGRNEANAVLGFAESLEGAGDLEMALQMLDQAVQYPETANQGLLKRAILRSKLNDLECLYDFDNYLLANPACSRGFFYKAEFLYTKSMFTEAALCYEQSIKYDKSFEFIPRAIFHLGAIKINEKDFYGALHTFDRAGKHELKDQKTLQIYAEAVINLMKRKYKDGISAFNKLIKKKEPVMKNNIMNCYMYRGYAYTALNQHEQAIRSFKKASVFGKINKASIYNLELSYGLLAASKQNYQVTMQHLEKCLKIFPRKAEPHLYHAAIVLNESLSKNEEYLLKEADDLMSHAMKMKEIDSEMLFFRACVRYIMQKFELALDDVKLAIDKAEDNIAEHYVLRGLCNAADRNYAESTQDFTIAIQLKESLEYIYWFRSRSAYLLEDTNLAFNDLQQHMILRPNDPEVYYQAAVLLIMGGSYDDALKALTNSFSLKSQSKTVYLKAKCYVIMNEIPEAINSLKYFKELKGPAYLDSEVLKFLSECKFDCFKVEEFLNAAQVVDKWLGLEAGDIFEKKHLFWLKGIFFMYAKEYTKSLNEFQRVLEMLHTKESKIISADEALTTEEENCEVLFNIALCHCFGKKNQSLCILNDLSEILNSKHRGQMLLLSAIIHLSNENSTAAENLLKEAFRCDPETTTPFLSKKTTTILPLNTTNPFAQRFPLISLQLSLNPIIQIRPAVSLPRSNLPNIEFCVEKEVESLFTIQKIVSRPEAPWLNRIRGSIQFTSTLVDIDEPSQISERESKERLVIHETGEYIKRNIKSAAPLRHNSSFIKRDANGDLKLSAEAPDDILDKIRNFCKGGKMDNLD